MYLYAETNDPDHGHTSFVVSAGLDVQSSPRQPDNRCGFHQDVRRERFTSENGSAQRPIDLLLPVQAQLPL